jgi:hypothetical protein
VGCVGSYYVLGGDHHETLSPYVTAYPIGNAHHRGFFQLGPRVVRHVTPSPVAEWSGTSSTRWGGELSAGYEYRHGLVVRVYGMMTAGQHVEPWLGLSVGWGL